MNKRRRRPRGNRPSALDLLRWAAAAGLPISEERTMPTQRRKAAPKRTRYTVTGAALVGVNWDNRKVSDSVYLMDQQFCHDLSFWLTKRIAHYVTKAKPNGHGWTHLVCWPGRGMFLVAVKEEQA